MIAGGNRERKIFASLGEFEGALADGQRPERIIGEPEVQTEIRPDPCEMLEIVDLDGYGLGFPEVADDGLCPAEREERYSQAETHVDRFLPRLCSLG